jgi:hypothetical protein
MISHQAPSQVLNIPETTNIFMTCAFSEILFTLSRRKGQPVEWSKDQRSWLLGKKDYQK